MLTCTIIDSCGPLLGCDLGENLCDKSKGNICQWASCDQQAGGGGLWTACITSGLGKGGGGLM